MLDPFLAILRHRRTRGVRSFCAFVCGFLCFGNNTIDSPIRFPASAFSTNYVHSGLADLFSAILAVAPNAILPRIRTARAIMDAHKGAPLMFVHRRPEDFADEYGSLIRAGLSHLRNLSADRVALNRASLKVCVFSFHRYTRM